MPQPTDNTTDEQTHNLICSSLYKWVFRQLAIENSQWLADQLNQLTLFADLSTDATARRQFDICFGLIPRRIEKKPLVLSADEQQHAHTLLPHWQPWTWQLDEAARILLISTAGSRAMRTKQIKTLLRHADLSEQLTIFRGLPLYPVDDILMDAVGEGLRSNISVVFETIAHNNPFPATQFSEHRFNHMVLKALFIDAPLNPIVGLMERNNSELTRMLVDYAYERTAANRTVAWELWQLAAPLATEKMLQPFIPILSVASADPMHLLSQKALVLALSGCAGIPPQQWVDKNEIERLTIDSNLSWEALLLEHNGHNH